MGGIVGFIQFKDSEDFCGSSFLAHAKERYIKSNIDNSGEIYFNDCRVGLAAGSLNITDVQREMPPRSNQENSVALALNGEIYNHEKLRGEYLNDSLSHAIPDNEVLLRLIEKYGKDSLPLLNGRFSFSAWDSLSNTLLIASDRFGEKTLYYYQDKNVFIFASEINTFFEVSFIEKMVSKSSLDNYLRWSVTPEPETILRNIHKVSPGNYIEINADDGSIKKDIYWKPNFKAESLSVSYKDAKDLLLKYLDNSIEKRIDKDASVGILLSGGVDSSALVARASQFTPNIHTFSIGFEEDGYNEFEHSRYIAEKYKTTHIEIILTAHEYWELLPLVTSSLNEPIADADTVALFHLCNKAKQSGFKSLLSGYGNNEILGGYSTRYLDGLKNIGGIGRLSDSLPCLLQSWFQKIAICKKGSNSPLMKLTQSQEEQYLQLSALGYEKKQLLSLYNETKFNGIEIRDDSFIDKIRGEASTSLQKMLSVDISALSLPATLMKVDKLGTSASIEIRLPFLDSDYVDFCLHLPDCYKITPHKKAVKTLFKNVFEEFLPRKFLNRKQSLFPVPITEWLRGELKENVYQLLFNSPVIAEFFNVEFIKKMWDSHQKKENDHAIKLWSLVLFVIWVKEHEIEAIK